MLLTDRVYPETVMVPFFAITKAIQKVPQVAPDFEVCPVAFDGSVTWTLVPHI